MGNIEKYYARAWALDPKDSAHIEDYIFKRWLLERWYLIEDFREEIKERPDEDPRDVIRRLVSQYVGNEVIHADLIASFLQVALDRVNWEDVVKIVLEEE